MNKYLLIGLVVFFLAFVLPVTYEFLSIRFDIGTGFKVIAVAVVEILRRFFWKIGFWIGRLVSIIEWFQLDKLVLSVETVISFWFQVLTSWWWMVVGYIEYLNIVKNSTMYVWITSAVVTFGPMIAMYKNQRLWNYLQTSDNRKAFAATCGLLGCLVIAIWIGRSKIPESWMSFDAWF